jgi:CHASE1-domain containing sensor protein
MEITSFVLGMLTIIAVILLTVIVVGMVKINQLEKQKHNLYQLCTSIEGDLRRLIEDTNRDITMVERTIMNRIDHEVEGIHKHEQEVETTLHHDIDETRRYIDSRIDKVVSSGALESSKRQING